MVERILALMEEHKINAAKLTSDLGLAISAVTDWKKGRNKPGTDAIIKIAEYFGVSTDFLLTGKENEALQASASNGAALTSQEKEMLEILNQFETKTKQRSFIAEVSKLADRILTEFAEDHFKRA
jgi:transcriptional regulator with XRE-family HTH domain